VYSRLFDFNKQRALFVEKLLGMAENKGLLPEDLIQHQRKLAAPFIGFRETKEFNGPVVDVFQEYTRSPGMPWGVSFIVYVVNYGVAELLSAMVDLRFPKPLPITPYVSEFSELPKTEQPLAGDLVINSESVWFVSKIMNDQVYGVGMFRKGKKHGVYEMPVTPEYFVDMSAVYRDFIEKSGEMTLNKVSEFV